MNPYTGSMGGSSGGLSGGSSMGGSSGGLSGNPSGNGSTIPWSDPNYWTGWNNTLGSLGGAITPWANLFNGNVQPTYYQDPRQQQNNTLIYVGMGLLFLVMMVVLFISLKKK